ncbi:hypothetical protein Daura_26235 [Dactylosporangium aurantiacum]|uniref:Uncharacterized protein n=1 Tax=Dactylosporangium aurantiacum TaxID=35754 RepID=A0A9Q9I9W0_9ACTN|nr:hypothetical protein [Dactylosporangium aurantiacum]MDG6109252.1 hypothetical protein [Dactylosporangium aurantiacum]UWZ50343.1 hypothetical protein Daura_26235 [Dactylosporangium aurantiacum]
MRRNILRFLGLALAAVAVILYINSIGDTGETATDPSTRLQCDEHSHIAAARATAAPTTRETRTPEQLATAWAQARSGTLLAGLHRVHEQPDRIDIAFDAKAHTVAVLTFRSYEPLGWHLDAVVACQQPATQRSSPPATAPSGP